MLRARRCLEIAQRGFGKGSSATTFPVPGGSEDLSLEGVGHFAGESRVVALSAAANAVPGDRADDRETGRGGSACRARDDAEAAGSGHWRRASSSWARARVS